jgi:hypothetical protein
MIGLPDDQQMAAVLLKDHCMLSSVSISRIASLSRPHPTGWTSAACS